MFELFRNNLYRHVIKFQFTNILAFYSTKTEISKVNAENLFKSGGRSLISKNHKLKDMRFSSFENNF